MSEVPVCHVLMAVPMVCTESAGEIYSYPHVQDRPLCIGSRCSACVHMAWLTREKKGSGGLERIAFVRCGLMPDYGRWWFDPAREPEEVEEGGGK